MIEISDETVFPYNLKHFSSTILIFSISFQCALALCLCISPCFYQVVYCKRTGNGRSATVKRQFNNYYESRDETIFEENQLRINFFKSNRYIISLGERFQQLCHCCDIFSVIFVIRI